MTDCWTGSVISGAHNDVKAEGKWRGVQRPHTRLKFECSHGSPVTIFSLYANLYKHVYGDFTKKKKQERVPGHYLQWSRGRKRWQTLRSAVRLGSRSSHFTPRVRRPLGCFHSQKELSLWLFWSWWLLGNISFSPYGYYFVSYNDPCRLASTVVGQWRTKCVHVYSYCFLLSQCQAYITFGNYPSFSSYTIHCFIWKTVQRGMKLQQFNLPIFILDHQIAKLKTSPNFPAVRYFTPV